jgi:hypothetical protein
VNRRVASRLATLICRLRYMEGFDDPTHNICAQIEAVGWSLEEFEKVYPAEYEEALRVADRREREHVRRREGDYASRGESEGNAHE